MRQVKVKKADIRKWVAALDSGKYQQAMHRLQTGDGYCCLGVACKLFIPNEKLNKHSDRRTMYGSTPISQPHAPEWLMCINDDFSRKTDYIDNLSSLNDNGYTFAEIATLLELVYIYNILD